MMKLNEINGIGEKTSELLNKLGIYTIEDLIYYFPRKYILIKHSDMSIANDGDRVVLDGMVECLPTVSIISNKLRKFMFRISNKTGVFNVVLYNQAFLANKLKCGVKVIIIGKFDKYKNVIVASEVRFGQLTSSKIETIYSTTNGLTQKSIVKYIGLALQVCGELVDYIPNYLQVRYNFLNKKSSVFQIHFPTSTIFYRKALQRLKYEEFFWYLLKLNYLKQQSSVGSISISRMVDFVKVEKFINKLPFTLTSDQEKTIKDIYNDLNSDKRMNRLVQGDVGCGKTIVAFIGGYINFLSGYQTALMVPTEILAVQHYHNALDLFKDTDMRIELLTSNVTKKKREKIYLDLKNGKINFIIGTQSLIQKDVEFFNLGLIITDEQHRFGVNQRNELLNKGDVPDVLSMSATPIPRTYALTIYGDMDISNIRTKPSGRKEVITYFKKDSEILDVLNLMKNELKLKHQIYVIAPSIEDDDGENLGNVMKLKEKMLLAFGKIANIEVVHGKLAPNVKNEVMKNFEQGLVDILISTTVIEVGVNVPNSSMIVVFDANLFGLSTLHQLRGRVGRGDIQSYCVLLAKEYHERLALLEHVSDGFKISEYDFKTRGEGDLFGIRQSGEAEFKLANVKTDFDLLLRVKKDVEEFLVNYSDLEEYKFLNDYLSDVGHLS